MPFLRLAAAQLDTVVGDLQGNVDRIVEALGRAEEQGADVLVTPELAITGYPPEDLLLKPGFVADNLVALDKVAASTGACAAVVGFVDRLGPGPLGARRVDGDVRAPNGPAGRLANAAAICADGRVVGVYHKRLLPNYGVFDEERWFEPGCEPLRLYEIAGVHVGVSICEDVWFDDGPVRAQGAAGAQIVVNLNASPYSIGRRAERLAVLRRRVAETGAVLAYVNQVGGQDELVFDGASLIVDVDGSLVAAGAQFRPELLVVDVPAQPRLFPPQTPRSRSWRSGEPCEPAEPFPPPSRRRCSTRWPRCTRPSCSAPATIW